MSKIAQRKRQCNKPGKDSGRKSEIPVYALQHGKRIVVGGIIQRPDGSWLLKKRISLSAHKLKKPGAIGWSVEALAEARALGCTAIQVTDRETGDTYESTMQHFLEKSLLVERNGGDDPQRALSLCHWRVNGNLSDFEQLSQPRVPRQPEPIQLPLIEVQRYV